MQAVFMANGPRFKKGIQIPFMRNIDLYHLFARLLNIEAFTTNLELDGIDQPDLWQEMLEDPDQETTFERLDVKIIVICIAVAFALSILVFLIFRRINYTKTLSKESLRF